MNMESTENNFTNLTLLNSEQQMIIGTYLLFVGLLGTFANGFVLVTFAKVRSLTAGSHSLLINLCVADLGMCLFGFPFSASSSFANRWLFGDGGCQGYAFLGFVFGTASICTVMMLAVDRYLVLCQKDEGLHRYRNMILFIWIFALFWSIMPLTGWGRYGMEPSGTTCTIDWRHNDILFKSFIMTYFAFGFALPLIVMGVSYYKAINQLRSMSGRSDDKLLDWANEKSITKLCILLLVAFIIFWSAYAVVCLWAVFGDPQSVPMTLALLPPLLAKASTVFNPLLYVIVNKRIREAVCAVALCKNSKSIQDFQRIPESSLMNVGGKMANTDGSCDEY